MINDDIEDRLLAAKAKSTITKIVKEVKLNENIEINRDVALDKFDSYTKKYNIHTSEKEDDYLKQLRVQMNSEGKISESFKLENSKELPENVISMNQFKRDLKKPKF